VQTNRFRLTDVFLGDAVGTDRRGELEGSNWRAARHGRPSLEGTTSCARADFDFPFHYVIDMRAIARVDKGWRDMIEQSLKAKLKEFASGRS
jgi:hypothetical protein